MSVVRGRPPGLAGGMSGSIKRYWSSLRAWPDPKSPTQVRSAGVHIVASRQGKVPGAPSARHSSPVKLTSTPFQNGLLAAGQGYKAARIPALTGTSVVDALTVDNPYYFRAQTPVSLQGRSIAEYLRHLFKARAISLLYSQDSFGQSFRQGFSEEYDNDKLVARGFEVGRDARAESIRAMVDAV